VQAGFAGSAEGLPVIQAIPLVRVDDEKVWKRLAMPICVMYLAIEDAPKDESAPSVQVICGKMPVCGGRMNVHGGHYGASDI
jgi:hypothetical protein